MDSGQVPGVTIPWEALAFNDSAEMFATFNDDIINGKRNFHPWQKELNDLVSASGYTQELPLKLILAANNGSGKDSFFISPVAVWLAASKIRHKVIITSASYKQISTQTEPYIRAYCERINRLTGENIFDIKQGEIKCIPSGSVIYMFVTDEAGKAEGAHPFEDYADAEMTIILNEAKSIPQELMKAFSRCTGFSRWLEISSTGKDSGHMYDAYCMANIYPQPCVPGKWYARKITIYDCPHISKASIEEDAIFFGGKDTEFFRSKYLSEFTSSAERVVVTLDQINRCLLNPPKWNGETEIVGGLDISGGRAETVFATRRGNQSLKMTCCQIKDAVMLVEYLTTVVFPQHDVTRKTRINADAGGMGDPVIDMLKAKGFNVLPVNNQSPSLNKKLYRNRGTYNFFNFGNAIKFGEIILYNDDKFKSQLSRRHYDLPDNDKIALISKKEEAAQGIDSPDRADAWCLAFIGYTIKSQRELRASIKERVKSAGNFSSVTQSELVEHMHQNRFKGFDGHNNIPAKRKADAGQLVQKNYIQELLSQHNQAYARLN